MKTSGWKPLEYVFEKPWLASILIGSSIHLFFYLEERLVVGNGYFSGLFEDLSRFPIRTIGRFLVPYLVPLIVTSVSHRVVIRKEQKSLFRFPRANPEIVMKLNETGRVIYLNPTAREYLVRAGLEAGEAQTILPDGYQEEIPGLLETGEVFTAMKNTGEIVLRYVFRAFEDERAVMVSGCDVTEQMATAEFIADAVPLMYRMKRDGTISFIGGSFKRLLPDSEFKNIRDALHQLGIRREETDEFHEKLLSSGRSESTEFRNTRNVEIKIDGKKRWHTWNGTVSVDGESLQGQLFDVHNQYLKDRQFDQLRNMTYGTAYLGERIALGLEDARDRDLSIAFIDIVDSTARVSSMSPDEAKEYIEAFSEVVTATVKKYSGYVDKFMGDGAMIVFGLQTGEKSELELHPSHSIKAAREIIDRFKEYNKTTSKEKHIHVRIGIESGIVRSGVFRNRDRMIFTSIGIPVITAARLEHKAEKDSILISRAHLERLPEGELQGLQCGVHQLKGLSRDIAACTIRGIRQ